AYEVPHPPQIKRPSRISTPRFERTRRSRRPLHSGQTKTSSAEVFMGSAASSLGGEAAAHRLFLQHGGGAVAQQHDADGSDQDVEVEEERAVLDVVQVVPHLLGLLFDVVGVAVAHLRPAGDTGTNGGAEAVVGNPLDEGPLVAGRVRTRT